ncbi:MAG TPA: universal stress protein [Tepidisphaeraceae bacterium]|jgi:nucleotide-binding universal stress UspA family protein
MYHKILVTLEATPTDRAIIDHVKQLAAITKSNLVLLHVATGVPAQLYGADAAGEEISEDQAYLHRIKKEFDAAGIPTVTELAYGDPIKQIIKWIEQHGCDLVAMSTHGHQWVGDLLFGTTATKIQHQISVPVLLLRAG